MIYYLPGCTTAALHPEAAARLKAYIMRNGMPEAPCCKEDVSILQEGDTVITCCTNCDLMFAERTPYIKVVSAYEYLLGDPEFPWPDLDGAEMTLQDCWRERDNRVIQDAVRECLKRMNVSVEVFADDSQPDTVAIHMMGDTLGILIGRRGETLDALQYLTSLQVNKGQDEYIRVTVDSENYRAKREDSLRRLALRMANRAQKTGRRVVLEPMNPYERRVLHTTLQNHPAVTTHSEGEEPNRHVVITLRNQPGAAKPENKEKNPGEGRSRKRGRRRGPKKANAAQNVPEMNGEEMPPVIEIVEEGSEE